MSGLDVTATNVKFAEAIANLRGKLTETTQAHDDLAGPVHAKVFTVAGAAKADLVRDLHKSLIAQLENGGTITAFRKDFDKAVAEHGWSYKGKRGWRTGVIFDTNMRSAHMAGRWSQIEAGKDRRPFLQYRTAGDARVRPQHRQWNGLIYPVDDAFWQTHYPPNGWGCRCTVRAYSQADLDDKALQVAPPFEGKTREVITRDGEIKDRVPVGIDPGWDHNVGQSWLAPELALGQKLARLPRELQGIVVDKTITPAFQEVLEGNWKAFRTAVKVSGKPRGDAQTLGFLDSATLNGLAEMVPELTLESTAVVAFDNRTTHLQGAHKLASNPAQVWPEASIDALPSELRNYRAVLWDTKDEVLLFVGQEPMRREVRHPGEQRWRKVVMRPNAKTKFGRGVSVVSLGSAETRNLTETRYVTLVGGMPSK